MLDIEPFPSCLLMSHLPGHRILYHHNQSVVKQMTYRLLTKIFSEREQIKV